MSLAYLLLGSNQGDKLYYLKQAELQIEIIIGKIIKKSSVYKSQAWGFESQNIFLNQALAVQTNFCPEELLANIHEIEIQLGRSRNENKYTDRTIDIDILFVDNLTIETTQLTVPHPHLHKRKFALIPLLELEQYFEHHVINKSLQILLEECEDKSAVLKFN